MLTATNLTVSYGAITALDGVSFTVPAGSIVTLVGGNGAGKTTTLRAISGLLRPTAGRVELNGKLISGLRAAEIVTEGVIHIPQGDLVFPEMTVLENLLMGAYRSEAWRERKQKLERVFSLFPRLAERKSQLARSLSGGERRMLALGRGLMSKARILMIDEPSLGLAPLIIENLYKTIQEINQSGLAVLLVDENADHVEGLANRVYLLEAGVLIREGRAEEMLRDEALLATYLG